MKRETHRHCQCDFCTGEDCGQDDPEKYKAEQEAIQKEHDAAIRKETLDDVMQYIRKKEWISSEFNSSMRVITVSPFETFIESLRTSPTHCTWSEDENGAYDTLCGEKFEFITGTPEDNKMRYCPYCGNPIDTKEQQP